LQGVYAVDVMDLFPSCGFESIGPVSAPGPTFLRGKKKAAGTLPLMLLF